MYNADDCWIEMQPTVKSMSARTYRRRFCLWLAFLGLQLDTKCGNLTAFKWKITIVNYDYFLPGLLEVLCITLGLEHAGI